VMNFNFQLAGTASTNPVLFGLGVFPGPGLEGRRLVGAGPLAAADARHAVGAPPERDAPRFGPRRSGPPRSSRRRITKGPPTNRPEALLIPLRSHPPGSGWAERSAGLRAIRPRSTLSTLVQPVGEAG
jgi:hypothetical protein